MLEPNAVSLSPSLFGFSAVEWSLQCLIYLLQVKMEMHVHESAFLLGSFQNYQMLGTPLFCYGKERHEIRLQ